MNLWTYSPPNKKVVQIVNKILILINLHIYNNIKPYNNYLESWSKRIYNKYVKQLSLYSLRKFENIITWKLEYVVSMKTVITKWQWISSKKRNCTGHTLKRLAASMKTDSYSYTLFWVLFVCSHGQPSEYDHYSFYYLENRCTSLKSTWCNH